MAMPTVTYLLLYFTTFKAGPSTHVPPPPRMTLAQRLHALRSGSPQTAVGGLDVHNASEWRAHHAAAQLAAKRLSPSARARVAAARGAAPTGEAEAAAAMANQTVALWEAALGRLANESASVPPTADAQELTLTLTRARARARARIRTLTPNP